MATKDKTGPDAPHHPTSPPQHNPDGTPVDPEEYHLGPAWNQAAQPEDYGDVTAEQIGDGIPQGKTAKRAGRGEPGEQVGQNPEAQGMDVRNPPQP